MEKYEYNYFEKMWNIFQCIKCFKAYEHGKLVSRDLCSSFLDELNIPVKNLGYFEVKEDLIFEKAMNKIFGFDCQKYLLKRIDDYESETFSKSFHLLCFPYHKQIIENLIIYSTPHLNDYKKKSVGINLQITLDAFNIKQAELDRKLGQNGAAAKLLNKGTANPRKEKVEDIVQALNTLIGEKLVEQSDNISAENFTPLSEAYYDQSLPEIRLAWILDDKNIPFYQYYENHLFSADDLYYGRISYKGKDKDYSNLEEKWLEQRYQKLRPEEKRLIYNTIYELIWSEWERQLQNLYKKFIKKNSLFDNNKSNQERILTPQEYFLSMPAK